MTKKDLILIVNTVLENSGKDTIKDISPGLSLTKHLNLTSLELAELTVRIEEKSGVDIFNDGIVQTIGEILERLGLNT